MMKNNTQTYVKPGKEHQDGRIFKKKPGMKWVKPDIQSLSVAAATGQLQPPGSPMQS